MGEALWQLRHPGDETALPSVAREVLAAVRAGTAGALFPPVVIAGPERTVALDRYPCGDRDARLIAGALSDPRFAPVLTTLGDVDRWCADTASRYAGTIDPGVLTVTNAGLFGPLISEVFVACAAGERSHTGRFAEQQVARHTAFLDLFLRRLDDDLREGWPDDPHLRGPVRAVRADDGETHNGRQRVLRVDLAGGGRVAYKPRPPAGEVLFAAASTGGDPGSVFELLNRLPPASGRVRLPTLRCWGGPGHLWQEWVEPPAGWGVVRETGPWRMEGPLLSPEEAARFWHRVGSLVAVCFGYGIVDLSGSNVVVGVRPGDAEPMLYPVDLEVYFAPAARLYDTSLVYDPAVDEGNHHVGLENDTRWCSVDGPVACFGEAPDGALTLRRRTASFLRRETPSVVTDTDGRTGYGPYLTSLLRGMFDGWTALCRHRARLHDLVDRVGDSCHVRVIRKRTSTYHEPLVDQWLSGGAAPVRGDDPAGPFDDDELEQLWRMDVPYFLRSSRGGPLLRVESPRPAPARVGPQPGEQWPPLDAVRRGEQFDLSGLGIALHDAVEHIFGDLPARARTDEEQGVWFDLTSKDRGEVGFAWPAAGKRIVYSWEHAKVRLRLITASLDEVKRRLLRLDRVDTALRTRWAAGEFTDPELERRLETLTKTAASWLRDVVAGHGWPGVAMVGAEAAAAATRLVQHSDDRDFQWRCLALMRAAAEAGDVAPGDVAAVVDAVRLADGRDQLYGTKFRRLGTTFVPYPIEAADQVDERREAMGMEPLDAYAERVRRRFTS